MRPLTVKALRAVNMVGLIFVLGVFVLVDLNGQIWGMSPVVSACFALVACVVTMGAATVLLLVEDRPRAVPVFSLVFCAVLIASIVGSTKWS